jgi:hypothetical protein
LLTRIQDLVKYNLETKPPADPTHVSINSLKSKIKALRDNPPRHLSQSIINWRIQQFQLQLNRQQKALQEGENLFANEMTTGGEDEYEDVDTSTAGQNKATVMKLQNEIAMRDMLIDKLKRDKKLVIKKTQPKKRKVIGWIGTTPSRERGRPVTQRRSLSPKRRTKKRSPPTQPVKRSPVQTRGMTSGKRRLSFGTPLPRPSYPSSSTRK